ncbi:MAG: ABC transporter substrate-binding protein [Pseudomonadota bacterium]|jgi:NitT/TauT family transport system substrate-binding protein|nr:ABC transporter substrate-binding protein [Pseudomonadota bacterium]
MQRRRFLGLALAAGFASGGLSGCWSRPPLTFGIHHWIGYEPLYLARDFGWLPESVTLRSGSSATNSMDGLLAGSLDGAALTLDETIRLISRGMDLVVVAVADVSAGADVLVVRPGIDSLADLRGRRVAVEMNGVSGILLLKILEVAGLDRNQLGLIDLPVSQHAEAWERGEVDASVSYEPVASLLVRAGGVRLFDSRQLPETIFDLLVVTRKTAAENPGAIEDLVAAHFAGLKHLVRGIHDALYRVANRQGVSPTDVRQALATITLPDLAANQRYLAQSGRIEVTAASLSRLMFGAGLIASQPSLQNLSNPSFLPRRLS